MVEFAIAQLCVQLIATDFETLTSQVVEELDGGAEYIWRHSPRSEFVTKTIAPFQLYVFVKLVYFVGDQLTGLSPFREVPS
jgi:hypothetical protein